MVDCSKAVVSSTFNLLKFKNISAAYMYVGVRVCGIFGDLDTVSSLYLPEITSVIL